MRGTARVREIVNRGATAAVMTMALAIVYGTVATQEPTSGTSFSQQVQTVLGLDISEQQESDVIQESLVTLLRYAPDSDHSR